MFHCNHVGRYFLAGLIILAGAAASYGDSDTSVVFRRCKFLGSRAVRGGALHCTGSGVLLENTLVVGNEVTEAGGGVYSDSAALKVVNSSIVANSEVNADQDYAGGIYSVGTGSVTVRNSILWNNDRDGDASAVEAQISGPAIDVAWSCVQDAYSEGCAPSIRAAWRIGSSTSRMRTARRWRYGSIRTWRRRTVRLRPPRPYRSRGWRVG